MGVWANQEPLEGSVTTEVTLTLARKSRSIEIINDSGTRALEFKFNDSESYATLKPLEAYSAYVWTNTIILQSADGNSVDYRVRSLG